MVSVQCHRDSTYQRMKDGAQVTGLRTGAGLALVEMLQDQPRDQAGQCATCLRRKVQPWDALVTTLDRSLPNKSICCGLRR